MSTNANPTGWLLLLYTLPTKKTAGRVNVWRKLKKIGSLSLKTAGHVLPDAPAHLERFQWITQQVKDDGGNATLVRVSSIEGLSNDELIALFNDARGQDYAEIVKPLNELIRANRKRIAEAFPEQLEKLRQQFREIRSIDFFGAPAGADVELLLEQASQINEPRSKPAGQLEAKKFHKRQWLTRPRPEIDRVGSAWLIKKFIDPQASFVFATSASAFPSALPYDMTDVEFTHHGDNCTFETLCARFAIKDSAVQKIGEMIHDADLEDGKFQRHECAGLDLLFKGWARLGHSDPEILEKGFACFDALYAAIARKG